AVKGVGTMV
nr:Chain C, ALA-VAL-LYS-GLY-VAL-GLY-THR-MET-VAL [unidentified influenza virus]5YMV_F Chain F, ALA-VAL-LYS-GLY-VAL-GLY-THR-MET-VAL [unidentified influenza virus]